MAESAFDRPDRRGNTKRRAGCRTRQVGLSYRRPVHGSLESPTGRRRRRRSATTLAGECQAFDGASRSDSRSRMAYAGAGEQEQLAVRWPSAEDADLSDVGRQSRKG
jgi:hypothetical protein